MTAASQHTGIPYRRSSLLDAGRVLLGDCAAVTRFGSPCARMQMRLFWQRSQGVAVMHKKLHAFCSMLPCKTIICHAGKDSPVARQAVGRAMRHQRSAATLKENYTCTIVRGR